MITNASLRGTPLENVNYSFGKYVAQKKEFDKKHMDGNGIPDYAYRMDVEYRKKLDSTPGIYKLAKTFCSTYVPSEIQKCSMKGIVVGPNQYPEIYKMAKECAETLGIGIPKVIVLPSMDGEDFNAYTIASDDIEPVVVITGLMVERMTPDELKVIIGHECGHIHNNHSVYLLLARVVLNAGIGALVNIPGLSQLASAMTQGVEILLGMWSRAAEVTSDRAALICSGNLDAAQTTFSKLMYKGADLSNTVNTKIDIEELRRQMISVTNNPYRLNELFSSHPIPVKRVIGVTDFYECRTLYEWRPDIADSKRKMYSKADIDTRCKAYFDVVNPKTKGARKVKK